MKVLNIIELIEKIAPLTAACPWDNSGVQIAAHGQDIATIAVCLDPTPKAMEQAVALGAQFILTHHPLLMKPQYLDKLSTYHQVVRTVMMHDAWLYSAHTSLDASVNGPVSWLAQELSLKDYHVLEPSLERPLDPTVFTDHAGQAQKNETLGLGMIGKLDHAISWDAFIARMQSLVPLDTATLCGPQPSMVQSIAYCTGSGSSLAGLAFAKGADIFITGDVKYHAALDTLGPILDVGHFSLEEEMMKRLASHVQALLGDTVAIHFMPSTDPLRPLAKL